MNTQCRRLCSWGIPLAALGSLTWGCTNEQIVEVFVTDTLTITDIDTVTVTRDLFNPPPDAASGLLGYFDASTGFTSCGNCHVGTQLEWEGTEHSDAFATLENSGGAQGFCYGCHTVSERGNDLVDPSGWNVVEDAAYHDVQCESCHGPGLDHVQAPGASQPIASLAIPATLDAGCAECHSGNHHPFAEEWAQSGHAQVVSFAAGNPACESCHRGQGTLKAWGVNATYLEEDAAEHLPTTCGVCHDPHNADNAAQLRFPVETAAVDQHLCAKCHNRRTVPDANSTHGLGPHAPASALLAGEAGWFPPGAPVQAGEIVTTHGAAVNTRLCATCHVNSFTVTDEETGSFVFQSTGHLFAGLPCVDATGVPTPGPCSVDPTAREFAGCSSLTACHGGDPADPSGANAALTASLLDVERLAGQLLDVLLQVDPELDDQGDGGEIDPENATFTVAEGSFFNYNLANFGAASEGDPATSESVLASTVHNPFLIKILLLSSLDAMQDEYGVVPTGPVVAPSWKAEIELVMGTVNNR